MRSEYSLDEELEKNGFKGLQLGSVALNFFKLAAEPLISHLSDVWSAL